MVIDYVLVEGDKIVHETILVSELDKLPGIIDKWLTERINPIQIASDSLSDRDLFDDLYCRAIICKNGFNFAETLEIGGKFRSGYITTAHYYMEKLEEYNIRRVSDVVHHLCGPVVVLKNYNQFLNHIKWFQNYVRW